MGDTNIFAEICNRPAYKTGSQFTSQSVSLGSIGLSG